MRTGSNPALTSSARDDEGAVKSALSDMWAAIEAGDVDRDAAYIHPEFTVFGESAMYLAEGKDIEIRNVRA